MEWTEEKVGMLRDLAEMGESSTNIAAAIGGVSRNAVIDKAMRMGIALRGGRADRPRTLQSTAPRAAARTPKAEKTQKSARAPKAPLIDKKPKAAPTSPLAGAALRAQRMVDAVRARAELERIAAPERPAVPLVDLTFSQCRFPLGDPRHEEFGFCGGRATRGSYCAACAARCFEAPHGGRR